MKVFIYYKYNYLLKIKYNYDEDTFI